MKEYDTPESNMSIAMRALGHPVRLNILTILAEKCDAQCCCTDITQCLPLAQSTVSQHIKVLLEAELIDRQARGTRNCYTVNMERLQVLQRAYEEYLETISKNLSRGCCSEAAESTKI